MTRLDLADGTTAVLKVPPTDNLLSYEVGLAEAAYLRLVEREAPELPVPRVLDEGDGWLLMTFLPGTPLPELPDGTRVRRELGAAVARLHQITGPRFGYSGDRPHAATWRAAYLAMIDGLLADAARWDVPLPDVRSVVAAAAPALDVVTRPALLHFDLWDGNVLGGAGGLTGLVDGERWLYGDPLVDFVSPALGRRIEAEPDHPYRAGYGPIELDPVRLALYRVQLDLIMLIECVPRRLDPVRAERIRRRLERDLASVGG